MNFIFLLSLFYKLPYPPLYVLPSPSPYFYCYAPEEIYKSNTLANVFYNSSEGFSTPVTSPLMPPKPARTERRHYSWRNSGKREVCMYIRILDPLEFRNNHKESMDERSMNYREAEYLFPIKGKGMMTSRIHDVTIQEQHGKPSLDTLVAKQYKPSQFRSQPSDSLGLRTAVQSYKKIAAIITVCFGMIMQLLEVFSRFALRKPKSTIGNSRIDSVDEGMWRWLLLSVYFLFECLSILWRYRHRIWPKLIMEGLWMGNKAISMTDERFYQLTFRLVIARYRLRNLLLDNVCRTNVSIGIGNTGDAFVAGNVNNVYLCPYSDLWASCHIYLCKDMEILGFLYKIGSFRILIYLYIGKLRSLWLSCKQASVFLAFPIKLCTLVYFVSKDSLLDRKSYNKYQCTNLIGLAPWEKAYMEIRPFSSHNGSDWRELRPLVTPWTWPIKQGIEPRKCQIGFSNLMSKVSFLLFSLLSFSCSCFNCYISYLLCYVLVKGKTVTSIRYKLSLSLSLWLYKDSGSRNTIYASFARYIMRVLAPIHAHNINSLAFSLSLSMAL